MRNVGISIITLVVASLTLTTRGGHTQEYSAARVSYVAMGGVNTIGGMLVDPATQSYPALLARHLPHGSRFLNAADHCGSVKDGVSVQLPQVIHVHPTLATVWFGLDDLEKLCGGPLPVRTFARDLDRILAAMQREHARVFVANLPDMRLVSTSSLGGDSGSASRGDRYNAIIADLVKRHGAVLVDIHAASRSLYTHPAYQTGPDFNARGDVILTQIFYRVMHRHGAL